MTRKTTDIRTPNCTAHVRGGEVIAVTRNQSGQRAVQNNLPDAERSTRRRATTRRTARQK